MYQVAKLLVLVVILGATVGMVRSGPPRSLPAPEMPDKVEISGYIDSMNSTTSSKPTAIVVSGAKVYVTSATQIINQRGTTRTTALKVGMKVTVIGFWSREGAIMATTIYIL